MQALIIFLVASVLAATSLAADQRQSLDGFADYKFGMTRAQVAASRKDHAVKKCNNPSTEYCVERRADIYGYPATVYAVFYPNENTLREVVVIIIIDKPAENSCIKSVNPILNTLIEKYGPSQKTEKSEYISLVTLEWYFWNGGKVKAVGLCADDSYGSISIIYGKTEAL